MISETLQLTDSIVEALNRGESTSRLIILGVGLIDSIDYRAVAWSAHRKGHIGDKEAGLRISSEGLGYETQQGMDCLSRAFPNAVEVIQQTEMDFPTFAEFSLYQLPFQEMTAQGLGFFSKGMVEVQGFLTHLNSSPSVRRRSFGNNFPVDLLTVDSLSRPAELIRAWLTHNVNDGEHLVRKSHENGAESWGLIGKAQVCPAPTQLIREIFGRTFMANQLLKLVAEKYRPDMLPKPLPW